jgi:hypothetical protein
MPDPRVLVTNVDIALAGRNGMLRLPTSQPVTSEWWDAFLDGENSRAWEDRDRVTLTAGGDETLGELFDRAIVELDAFDADWSKWTYDGSEPGRRTARLMALRADDSPLPLLERMSNDITVVDDEGRGVFSVSHHEVTFGQLQRSSRAGAIYGDPTQIYLFIRWEPAGGGIAHTWEVLVDAWEVFDVVAEAIGIGAAAYKVATAVRRRLAGRVVIDERAREWVRRNGGADYIARTLRGDPWHPRDFAGIHGGTVQDAEGVLALFGYSANPTNGAWIFTAGDPTVGLASTDPSAELVVRYTREVLWRFPDEARAPTAELRAIAKAMLERAGAGSDMSEFGYRGSSRLWPGVWGEGRNWFG